MYKTDGLEFILKLTIEVTQDADSVTIILVIEITNARTKLHRMLFCNNTQQTSTSATPLTVRGVSSLGKTSVSPGRSKRCSSACVRCEC